jgi:hypothetical protein
MGLLQSRCTQFADWRTLIFQHCPHFYCKSLRQSHHVKPSDFIVGDPIQAHLEGEKMVVVDPSGKQIKEKIIRRERLPTKP